LLAVALSSFSSLSYAGDAPASPHTVTANVGLYSQYIYRGMTQTKEKPAIQGGFDYSHASGFYLGTWGSNISWLEDAGVATGASLELDIYGGYKGTAGDLGYDVGLLQYWYPGHYAAGATKANTTEAYGALSYGMFTGKLSVVVSDGLFGVPDERGSWYLDLGANVPLSEGLTLNAHVGRQAFDAANASYTDWKLGLTKDLGNGWSGTIFYTDTNAKKAVYSDLGDAHLVVGVSRSF
jgi:uncharacterized protein (TIGR02001 family)